MEGAIMALAKEPLFDFGFTAVNEDELEAVQKAVEVGESAVALEEKVNQLHKAILPLLANLRKNPEKDYIFWPNRVAKVDEFEKMLNDIVNG